jgi:hypothetical protein
MLFGSTSFSAAPFSSPYIQDFTVAVTGNRLNISIGNTSIALPITVLVTGNQINLATDTVDVVNWDLIVPGATGKWVPIDPNNP